MTLLKERVANSFSKCAKDYDGNAVTQQIIVKDLLEFATDYIVKEDKILDLGCGPGTIGNMLLDHDLVQLDIAENMCAFARRNGHDAICADIENIPFSDNSFSLVISSMALQWVEDKHKAAHEISRIVRKQGKVVLSLLLDESFSDLRLKIDRKEAFFQYIDFLPFSELLKENRLKVVAQDKRVYLEYYNNLLEALRHIKNIGAFEKKDANSLTNLFGFRKSPAITLDYKVAFLILEKF